ncbi:hypothetical protein LTR66_011050 [Elasticomyces elasticus]|nr:hypothetical protein LTR66_011050 [Elasticomyces elasticus]
MARSVVRRSSPIAKAMEAPSAVRIKRKREEEPPTTLGNKSRVSRSLPQGLTDSLVLQRHKRLHLAVSIHYQRQLDDDPKENVPPNHVAGKPPVGKPGTETGLKESSVPPRVAREGSSSRQNTDHHGPTPTASRTTTTAFPKRFLLARSTSQDCLSETKAATNGIYKDSKIKAQNGRIATFAEARELRTVEEVASRTSTTTPDSVGSKVKNELPSSPPRKRPSVKARGAGARVVSMVGAPQGVAQDSAPPDELMLKMQQFALEEEARHRISVPEEGTGHVAPSKPKLKYQPKTTVVRHNDRRSSMESLTSSQIPEDSDVDMDTASDDGEFVYDTYVRSAAPQSLSDALESAPGSDVGYLVITEEDEKFWERYIEEDSDSGKDWNSEEEDENAEDYYGADYPEDEVASDDEFGEGAYGYRHGGSDDEEWDTREGSSGAEGEEM